MFWRILWQSIWQNRKRSVLSILTVAIAASLGMALAVLSIGVGDKMSIEMRSYGSNLTVKPKAEALSASLSTYTRNPLHGQDALQESDLLQIKDIYWRNNIIGIMPVQRTMAQTVQHQQPIHVFGTYFKHDISLPDGEMFTVGVRSVHNHWDVQGNWPLMEKPDQVLVGKTLAKKLGIEVGNTLTLQDKQGHKYATVITGIVRTGGEVDNAVVTQVKLTQAIKAANGMVDEFQISALTVPENALSRMAHNNAEMLTDSEYDSWYCTAYISSIAHQIEEVLPNTSTQPIWKVAAGEGAVITKMQILLLVVSIAAFASAAMGVSSLMMATVSERAREIGLMKALGAIRSEILWSFISEAIALGLLGGIMGASFGAVLSQFISTMVFGTGMDIPWVVVPLIVIFSVIIGLIGAIVPARKIANVAPVEVLYGKR